MTATNFLEQLDEIKTTNWELSTSRGVPIIQQTIRNTTRTELLEGLKAWLEPLLPNAVLDLTSSGIAISLENEFIGEKVEDSPGFITLMLDLHIRDLVFDAAMDAETYEFERAKKAQKAQKAQNKPSKK